MERPLLVSLFAVHQNFLRVERPKAAVVLVESERQGVDRTNSLLKMGVNPQEVKEPERELQ